MFHYFVNSSEVNAKSTFAVAFLDNDNWGTPGALRRLDNAFLEHLLYFGINDLLASLDSAANTVV